MIRSKDVNAEVKPLDIKASMTPEKVTMGDVLKAVLLGVKILRDMRTNQVSWMRKEYGKEIFVKSQRPKPEGDGKKEVKK